MALLHLSLWAALSGACAPLGTASVPPSAVAASPAPTPAPAGAATFGAVQAIRKAEENRVIIHRQEQPEGRLPGAGTFYYVTVDGMDYPIHYEYAEKVKTLQVGQTVNLHPSDQLVCEIGPDGAATCRVLMRLFKNSRRINPIGY